MTLDLGQVTTQIEAMAENLRLTSRTRSDRVASAVEILREQSQQFDRLKAKIELSRGKTTWLVAGLKTGLDRGNHAGTPATE